MSDWSIFPNGTAFMMWRDRNCDVCTKDYCESKQPDGSNPNCPIEEAISLAYALDGKLPDANRTEIAARLKWDGKTYLEHDCPEFDPAP